MTCSQLTQPVILDSQEIESVMELTETPACWGVLTGFLPERKFELRGTDSSYWLGRGSDCQVRFNNLMVSGHHCKIFYQAGAAAFLLDDSTNGTFVNDKRIGKGKTTILKDGDLVSLSLRIPNEENLDLFYVYEDNMSSRSNKKNRDPEELQVKLHYHITERVLGEGNSASVRLAYEKSTGEQRAVKILTKEQLIAKPKQQENLEAEISILQRISHPNIVKIFDVMDTSQYVYIFLELVPDGELFKAISQSALDEVTSKVYFAQMLLAVQYLHNNKVSHRDLKPENILLQRNKTTHPYAIVKITDFGLAKIAANTSMKTVCGTPNYLAPEILRCSSYSNAVDCWSLGVILYAMLSGTLPFQDQGEYMHGTLNILFPEQDWENISEDAKDLICLFLNPDPKERLTVKQALSHPWLSDKKVWNMVDRIVFPEKYKEEKEGQKNNKEEPVKIAQKENDSSVKKKESSSTSAPPAKRIRTA
eukprot:Lithocolla_globosa_v1_NODE_722_length_3383_cov_12.786959.p1 type:complete len:477 gc:universal NODE_722_length_3383_cov_12.786959:1874-3304(+)